MDVSLSMGLTTDGGFEYFFNRGEGVDFRLNQVNREHLRQGDLIEFLEDPGENRRYLVELIKIFKSDNFSNLIESLPSDLPEKNDKAQIVTSLAQWWKPEDEAKRGVIGYYFKVASRML